MNKTNDKLNYLSAKQTEMEDESATWQAKMLMNKNQATKARAEAEAAHKQAQNVENVSLLSRVKEKKKTSSMFNSIFASKVLPCCHQNTILSLCHTVQNATG